MDNLLEKLNSEQFQAVQHKDGPLLIVAGAGTGKTTVITQRIAYLIEQGQAQPDEILALTFTEKAAAEMEERVDRLLPMGYVDLWISTFHSFGEKILKDYGFEIGLPGDAKLLNEFEQWALIQKNLDKFELDYYRPLGNPTKFIHALIKHFSRLKDEDISPQLYLDYAEELLENLDNKLSGAKQSPTPRPIGHPSQEGNSPPAEGAASTGSKSTKVKQEYSPLGRGAAEPGGGVPDTADQEIEVQEVARINEVANAYHVYQQLLLDEGAMDFGDLINYTLRLFRERPAVLDKFRQQFKFIMLDEFQDTNLAQYELIKLLAQPQNNLVVVGDDDQSIYKFRGASVSNILQFKKDFPKSKQIVLINNYRNRQNILDLSYDFIQLNNPNRLEAQAGAGNTPRPIGHPSQGGNLPPAEESAPAGGKSAKDKQEYSPLERGTAEPVGVLPLSKKLKANKKGQGTIEVITGTDLQDELKQVIQKIADIKIKDKSLNWSDFAILVRANASAKEICALLDVADLPYQFLASAGLYNQPVIMDVVAYLKLLDSYHENNAVFRILNLPVFNFTTEEVINFNYIANKKAWSLFTVLRNANGKLGPALKEKTDRVVNLVEKHTALTRTKTVQEIVMAFMEDSGYLKHITDLPERESREILAYLQQFMKRVQQFEAGSDDRSVKAFLHEFELELKAGGEGSLRPDAEAGSDTIKVMTIHTAKGLEFKHVFIANMVDKRFPSIARREPIEIPEPLVKEIVPEGDLHLEEERRLFYVAATRAEEGLYFSWAPDYGGVRKKKPSRFLEEAGLLADAKISNNQHSTSIQYPISNIQLSDRGKTENRISFTPPTYFSFTQLAAYDNCPYQYRFAHILKIPRRGKAPFSFGKTMHSTLQETFKRLNEKKNLGQADLFGGEQKVDRQPEISVEEMLEIFDECWIDEWYESKKQKEEYKKKGKDIIKDFHQKHQGQWPQAQYLEKGFAIKLKSDQDVFTVRGNIDRVDAVKQDTVKLVDYKTGKPKEKLDFKDKEQLLIYQIAIEEVVGLKADSLAFYYLENNSEIEFLGSDEDLDKLKHKMIDTILNIRKGEFLPKPGPLCKFCDFFDICDYRKS